MRGPSSTSRPCWSNRRRTSNSAYYLAVAYKETGRVEESVALLESVLARRPDLFMAHFHLGATLLRLGNSARGLHHIPPV